MLANMYLAILDYRTEGSFIATGAPMEVLLLWGKLEKVQRPAAKQVWHAVRLRNPLTSQERRYRTAARSSAAHIDCGSESAGSGYLVYTRPACADGFDPVTLLGSFGPLGPSGFPVMLSHGTD